MWFFSRRGLRILLYHRTATAEGDGLTVTAGQLRRQIEWLHQAGYVFVTVAEVIAAAAGSTALPRRAALVTFDDATTDTHDLAWPLLREFGVKAAVFVPSAFVGAATSWDRDAHPVMTPAQLAALAADGWELGLHSHSHRSFADLTAAEIEADVRRNLAAFADWKLTPAPAIAYPYGHRPRARDARAAMERALRGCGVRIGFRIGGRINRALDPFELNRIVIRGDESFAAFRRKMAWGRIL